MQGSVKVSSAYESEISRLRAGAAQPRRLTILGATGSIGCSTADVLEAVPGKFAVEAIAGGSDAAALAAMAKRLDASHAVIADESCFLELKGLLSGTRTTVAAGNEALRECATRPVDLVIGAIAGAAGVEPTYAAIEAGQTVALANKECLVCAGEPFMQTVRRHGNILLPMDSEHNAIFQAMAGNDASKIAQMILTASGGPFRTWSLEAIADASPEQALAHPNWDMGPKVTVDSATLMNKGLELIEAHYLFGVSADQLSVLVHPQSIVHGLVTYADGSMVAGLANPDMKVPIAHCLGWPGRLESGVSPLDLADIAALTFEKPDLQRFPALALAMDALRHGGALPTVLNAANEVAVELFLNRQIGFPDIATLVAQTCDRFLQQGSAGAPLSIADALAVDHVSREIARASWRT